MSRHATAAVSVLATLIATASASGTPPAPIGVATQAADGTIVLQLRTPPSSGVIGDALIRYRPDDPNYAEVAEHVGLIPKGGSVLVMPFGK